MASRKKRLRSTPAPILNARTKAVIRDAAERIRANEEAREHRAHIYYRTRYPSLVYTAWRLWNRLARGGSSRELP